MPFKVQVGPHQVSIHHGQTVLVSESDGQINWPSEKGLYFFDTRVISSWTMYANGEPWELLNGGAITHNASRTHLTNRRIPTSHGIIPPRTLGLVVSRLIGEGMHEDLEITNNSMRRAEFQLEIALRLRRYIRNKVEQHRAPRTYRHDVVAGQAATADQLPQCRFLPRRNGGSVA
jgi:hypothetical protein